MSLSQERRSSKRNFDSEAELQIKILEQRAREDFLVDFSQIDASTDPKHLSNEKPLKQKGTENEAKVYIPAMAKKVLEKWMYDHRLYCYPTKTEKQSLALETGLSVQKISNWFINSRRRMLPKMLQTEGRNPTNFTISRKKKKNEAPKTVEVNKMANTVPEDVLSTYAIEEESKIIDQNSIFFGEDFEVDDQQSNLIEEVVQEVIVPYSGGELDNIPATNEQPEIEEKQCTRITRGILYDQPTRSKCFFIIVNSTK